MLRLCVILTSALALCALVAGPGVSGDKKDPPVKKKALPQGWGKLGLSDEQKSKIQDVMAKYGSKIDALKKQLEELKDAELADRLKILTEAQREQLRQDALKKAGGTDKKAADDKKTTADKKTAEDKKKDPDKK